MTTAAPRNTKAIRVKEALQADMDARAFGDSHILPTEAELCRRYRASRETVRKALRLLTTDGVLTWIPNRGVLINASRQEGGHKRQIHISVLTAYPYKSGNYYYQGVLAGLVAGSHEMGVSLSFTARTPNTDLGSVIQREPTILWPAESNDLASLQNLTRAKRYFVVMSAAFPHTDIPCVDCDNVMGAKQAIDHLLAHGHQRIGTVMRSVRLSRDHVQRSDAARERLQERSLPCPAFVPEDQWSPAVYAETFARWLKQHGVTAVFTMDLEVAGIVYAACEQQGIRIPGHLSIVSFDDSVLAEVYSPPLTTISQPIEEIGLRAVERLATAVRNRKPCHGSELLPTRLVVRASVASPAG